MENIGKAKIISSTRFNENVGHFKNNKSEKSAVSAHCMKQTTTLIKIVNYKKTVRLNAREC